MGNLLPRSRERDDVTTLKTENRSGGYTLPRCRSPGPPRPIELKPSQIQHMLGKLKIIFNINIELTVTIIFR